MKAFFAVGAVLLLLAVPLFGSGSSANPVEDADHVICISSTATGSFHRAILPGETSFCFSSCEWILSDAGDWTFSDGDSAASYTVASVPAAVPMTLSSGDAHSIIWTSPSGDTFSFVLTVSGSLHFDDGTDDDSNSSAMYSSAAFSGAIAASCLLTIVGFLIAYFIARRRAASEVSNV